MRPIYSVSKRHQTATQLWFRNSRLIGDSYDIPMIHGNIRSLRGFRRVDLHHPFYYYMSMELSELMKALADTNRLRILNLLQDQTLCVCDIEAILGLNQSNLSRHLAKLRQVGLVLVQKRALFSYYARIPLPPPYGQVVSELYSAMRNDSIFSRDLKNLALRQAQTEKSC